LKTTVHFAIRGLALLALAVPFVLAVACAKAGPPPPTPEQVAAGQKVFLGTCATCHGKDANGLPRLGKGLHYNEFVKSKTDEELMAFIKTGRPAADPLNTTGVDMPPKGGNPALTDQNIADVIAFVRSLQ
jgi:disulfide bond formation protein DsbB